MLTPELQEKLNAIKSLTTDQWEAARVRAIDLTAALITPPNPEHFKNRMLSKYPTWFTYGVLAGIAFMAIAAQFISAGKLITAVDMALQPVASGDEKLSQTWVALSVVFAILMGEIGAILLSTASSILKGDSTMIGKYKVYPVAWLFRVGSLLCAGFAILSNISITELHAKELTNISTFAWYLALIAPGLVLFVGLLLERFLLEYLNARSEANTAFNDAMRQYEIRASDPTQHPRWMELWGKSIFDAVRAVSSPNARKVDDLVGIDNTMRLVIVKREYANHNWQVMDIAKLAGQSAAQEVVAAITPLSQQESNRSMQIQPVQQ